MNKSILWRFPLPCLLAVVASFAVSSLMGSHLQSIGRGCRLPENRRLGPSEGFRAFSCMKAAAILIAVCLVGCCPLAIMTPVATAADDYVWTPMDLEVPDGHPGFGITAIWGSSSSNVWAVGTYGAYFRYDGSNWIYSPNDPNPNPGGVSGSHRDVHGTSAANVFVVGGKYGGTLNRYDGDMWQEICPELHYFSDAGYYAGYLKAVWASATDVFTLGSNNRVIVRYDGDHCSHLDTGIEDSQVELWDIWGSSVGSSVTNVYAVGGGGTILRFDGSAWTTIDSGVSEDLYGVWGTSAADIYAVGSSGTIVHFNGSTWSRMSAGTNARLYGVWCIPPRDVFVVGASATVLHYDGFAWSPIDFDQSLGVPEFTCVWASSPSDIFVASGRNIYHYGPSTASDDGISPDDSDDGVVPAGGTAEDETSIWIIIGAAVGGAVGGMAIMAASAFLFWKWRRGSRA